MSHTHLLYHIVFGTKERQPIISSEWESELHSYLVGIVNNLGGRGLEVNGISDHVHLLVRLEPKLAIADFMRELKASSSRWVRTTHYPKFSWQRRYGAFTVSESASRAVQEYIRSQKEHHRKQTFADEYKGLLVKHSVKFDDEFLWG